MKINRDNAGLSVDLERMLGYLEQDAQNILLAFDVIDLCFAENQLGLAQEVLGAIGDDDHPGVRNRVAIAALRRNDARTAIDQLERLASAADADGAVLYNLGYAHYIEGDYRRARSVLERWVARGGSVPGAASLYVLCLQQMGDTEAAVAFAEQSVQTGVDASELKGVLALIYLDTERDLVRCREYADAALAANPDHPMALIAAGSLAMMDEQPATAFALYKRVVQRNPADGRAWSALGVSHLYQLDLPAARAALETAVRHIPGHIGTWHALAWVQLMQNDVAAAERSYLKALELDRNFGDTHGGLAITAYLGGDKPRAKSLMERAQRLSPAGMTLQYLKLLQLQETGDQEAVQQFLKRALARSPGFRGHSALDLMVRIGALAPQHGDHSKLH